MAVQPHHAPAYFPAPTPLLGLNSSSSCSPSSSSSRTHQHQHGLLHLPAASPTSTPPCTTHRSHDDDDASDAALLSLLRGGHTDAAYRLFASTPSLPQSPTSASRLLAQLSYKSTSSSAFSRAARLLHRLRAHGALNLLDANSLSLAASAAARSNNAHLAYSLLLSMLRRGLLPDRRAYTAAVSRLRPAHALRLFDAVLHHLRRAPSDIVSCSSFSLPDTAAFNAALSACADAGDCRHFRQLFDEMHRWSATPDALTYNVVIKMCARAGRKDLVARVLERIISCGLTPCGTTFHSLVAAYVGFGDIPTAERIVQAMREDRNDLCLLLRAVAMEGDAGVVVSQEQSAVLEDIVGAMPEQGTEVPLLPKTYPPNSRVYTTLMKGYMNDGRVNDVVAMVRAMRREGEAKPASRPDHVTYTTVISTLVAAGETERAGAVLEEMAGAGVPANRITYNVLLKGYCRQLQMGKAREVLREMMSRGVEPDVVTYNTLIDGCVLTDDSTGALALFNEMRSHGIAPSTVSYTTLMKAFATSGQPKLAHKVFEEMERDPRVAVDRAAWNMLVEGYCRLGLLETAKQVVEKMKAQHGMQPDVATYGSLAKGIAVARKPGEALVLWNEVKERCQGKPPLRPDEELLDALADVCVRAAFFRKALEIVACMEEMGIAPNKTKYKKIYIEMHSRMFTSRHASQARQDRRRDRKRAAEAFKFWLGLPNSYYGSEWRIEPLADDPSSYDDAS